MKILNFFNNIFVKNLLLAIAIVLILIYATLKWLDSYTNHGQQVMVPDVKGMQVVDAAPLLEQKTLKYEVVDSTFVKNKVPGSILETVPPVGTNVKEGRTIYITINAFTAQMLIIPAVQDMSQRQALAMLKSVGFDVVEVKYVPGAYRDLVLRLEVNDEELEPGSKVNASTSISLIVSSGEIEEELIEVDSIPEFSTEESWF
ncbi:beta-lactam-binding protein with PASTA domain [Dysgonomonadaceae bacterium PH5-43]|nr:beta-lactam-binding protein with PASTA domain [Dysgonomonadaceae bacterium PH5-43]